MTDDQPLMTFKSHIEGRNADVSVYVDRLEWERRGRMVRSKGSEMIPVKSISSVVTARAGLSLTMVRVICSGNTIDFRVGTAQAVAVKDTLTALVLGSHPAQQSPSAAASHLSHLPPPPPMPPAAVVPARLAGWAADPGGRHELRYWDGEAWTANVSDAGVQAVDPV